MKRALLFFTSVAVLAAVVPASLAGEVHDAVLKREVAALDRILKANPSAVNVRQAADLRTPIFIAVAMGDPAMVKRLLAAKADLTIPDAKGQTPLRRATYIAGEEVLAKLSAPMLARVKDPTNKESADVVGMIAAVDPVEKQARLEVLKLLAAQKQDLDTVHGIGGAPLQIAASSGSSEAVKVLIEAGADAGIRDAGSWRPVHYAAAAGAGRELFEQLIKGGANIDASAAEGMTPLMVAARVGRKDAVEVLLSLGARIDAENNANISAIGCAAQTGKEDVVRLLAEKGGRELFRDAAKDKLLHAAARGGSKVLAELLLAEGVDINVRDESGFTPLLRAVEWNRREVAKFLIEKGADKSAETKAGMDLFFIACQAGDAAIVKEQIAAGADAKKPRNGIPPLAAAAMGGRAEVAELLIAAGADVNVASSNGLTPLLGAVWGRALGLEAASRGVDVDNLPGEDDFACIVDLLLARGAKVKVTVSDELTPMYIAARHCGAHVMKALIAAGGDPSEIAVGTPLHGAATAGRAETAKVLLDAGADPDVPSKANGETPLHLAARNDNSEVLKELLAKSRRVDATNNSKEYTALHYAAMFNSPECARLLLEAGANLNVKDGRGATALVFAVSPRQALESLGQPASQQDARLAPRILDLPARLRLIQLLLAAGASTEATVKPDAAGEPLPLMLIAEKFGAPEIVSLLKQSAKTPAKPRKK